MTEKTLTAQKLHAVLRKTGVEKSETFGGGPIPGMSTTTYGYEVETDGYVESKCRYCHGIGCHTTATCIGHGTRKTRDGFRQRKVKTGTFTLRLNERTGISGINDRRTARDRARIVEALNGAGFAYQAIGENTWRVTGFEDEETA